MRLGFLTYLCWWRYGPFWQGLVEAAELTPVQVSAEAVRAHLTQPDVTNIGPLAFQLAAAEALALQDCDALVVPRVNPEADVHNPVHKGAAQDPWLASFPEVLQTQFRALPPLLAVPMALPTGPSDPSFAAFEGVATTLLTGLLHNPGQVRRIWQSWRGRVSSFVSRPKPVTWQRASHTTVGVIAQPWNLGYLEDEVLEQLFNKDEHIVHQGQFAQIDLHDEGRRLEMSLLDSDLEVLGAARLMGRRGSVSKLVFIADEGSSTDSWLARRIQDISHKPVEVLTLQSLVEF
ncbi:MAG: hypothetical protein AAF267_00405 [Deinococcota bacterium]